MLQTSKLLLLLEATRRLAILPGESDSCLPFILPPVFLVDTWTQRFLSLKAFSEICHHGRSFHMPLLRLLEHSSAPLLLILDIMVRETVEEFMCMSFSDDLWKLDGGIRQVTGGQATAGLFTTFPPDHMSVWGSLLDQVTTHLCYRFLYQFLFWKAINLILNASHCNSGKKLTLSFEPRNDDWRFW